MTQEEKAKAYDEAVKRVETMKAGECKTTFMFTEGLLEYIFPELAGSENETIRKALINGFNKLDKSAVWYNGITNAQILDWLEKQAEHANFRNKIQIGDKVTRNRDGYLINLSQLNRVAKVEEKQGEQKPADKVIEEEKSLLERFKQAVYDCAWEKVTCTKEGETKEEYANRWAEQLLVLVRDWADDYIDSREDVIRRRFFDKGKQSMYKPAWSEEDEEMLKMVIKLCEQCGNEYAYYWLKSLKDRVQLQPKPAWSEDDKERIKNIISVLDVQVCWDGATGKKGNPYQKEIDWLKSLRPQNRWKPSEEMIEALGRLIPENVMEISEDEILLGKLYQGLKYGRVLSKK